MIKKNTIRIVLILLAALILISVISAIGASNSVPNVRLTDQSFSVTISDFTPPECATLNLTNIVYASGFTVGTNAGDLMLGSPSGEIIFGGGGEDCIVGGGGNDILLGDAATDVCIGGPGNDSFQFWFWGGCETQIQ